MLGVGEEVRVRVMVRPGGTEGARSNIADAFSPDVADPDWSNNTASAGFSVTPLADLTVTRVADKTSVPETLPLDVIFLSISGAACAEPAARSIS